MAKDFKAILVRYRFTDELGHALENCVDYQELLAAAEGGARYRFVSDDDGHAYLIPAGKKEAFNAWLDHQGRLWEPGLSEEEFKRRDAEYAGEDFDDYKIDAHEHYTFEKPEAD